MRQVTNLPHEAGWSTGWRVTPPPAADGVGDDGGRLVEAVVVPVGAADGGAAVFDLASLAVVAGLTVAELAAEVDPDGADLEALCRSYGAGLPAKIKVKAELRAARGAQEVAKVQELFLHSHFLPLHCFCIF
jgi:hypothetical protein